MYFNKINHHFYNYSDTILKRHLFFSNAASKLIDSNYIICRKNAGTDVCGYGADIDVFLDAQEYASDLNLKNSDFKAVLKEHNTVQISFTVMPGKGKFFYRKRLLVLVNEKGKWRVDDMITADENGKFTKENSMRNIILQEIAIYK